MKNEWQLINVLNVVLGTIKYKIVDVTKDCLRIEIDDKKFRISIESLNVEECHDSLLASTLEARLLERLIKFMYAKLKEE